MVLVKWFSYVLAGACVVALVWGGAVFFVQVVKSVHYGPMKTAELLSECGFDRDARRIARAPSTACGEYIRERAGLGNLRSGIAAPRTRGASGLICAGALRNVTERELAELFAGWARPYARPGTAESVLADVVIEQGLLRDYPCPPRSP
ncbi:MAG: hypothetical protein OXH15_10105 [Gammaproteobacteria bacterium]|nr:hypothetical protein [Gammaproteobacteria bacterium]